jgi:Kdo2-lipid IVA lauroyltransferase/acyltransferase
MKRLAHIFSWLVAGWLILVSLVPLRVLLCLSPVLSFFVGRVFRYRREVVIMNLARSFPEKSKEDIDAVCRQFYLHLADVFFETISLFSAPRRVIRKRFVADPEALKMVNTLIHNGRTVICMTGHLGNWEILLPAFYQVFSGSILAVYRPLVNRPFDWFIARIRKRFCDGIVHDRRVARTLVRLRNEARPAAIGLVSDQSPGKQELTWLQFLNQDTAVFTGPERLIRMFDLPVVFMWPRKTSRGHYRVHVELIAEQPGELPEGEITKRFFAMLEREIRINPPHYLWSHRRWKKKR